MTELTSTGYWGMGHTWRVCGQCYWLHKLMICFKIQLFFGTIYRKNYNDFSNQNYGFPYAYQVAYVDVMLLSNLLIK